MIMAAELFKSLYTILGIFIVMFWLITMICETMRQQLQNSRLTPQKILILIKYQKLCLYSFYISGSLVLLWIVGFLIFY